MRNAECGVNFELAPLVHEVKSCVHFSLHAPHSALRSLLTSTATEATKDWSCHSYCKFSRVGKSMWRLLKEFLLFARQEKKWWLIPLVVLLLVLGAILIFASSSGIAWALYPLF